MDADTRDWWLRMADRLRRQPNQAEALRTAQHCADKLVQMAQTGPGGDPWVMQAFRDLIIDLKGKKP